MKTVPICIVVLILVGCNNVSSGQSIIKKTVKRFFIKKDYGNHLLVSQGVMDIPGIFNKTVKWYRYKSNSYVAYERKICKNWGAGLRYAKWGAGFFDNNEFNVGQHYYTSPDPNSSTIDHTGELFQRTNYRMIDLYAISSIKIIKKHINLRFGVGPSYTWGHDVYIKSYVAIPNPMHEIMIQLEYKKAHYWGISPQIGVELLLLKNRLSLGMDAIGRYYNSIPHNEYDFMWHLGINF